MIILQVLKNEFMSHYELVLTSVIVLNIAAMIAAIRRIRLAYSIHLITNTQRSTLMLFAIMVPVLGFALIMRILSKPNKQVAPEIK